MRTCQGLKEFVQSCLASQPADGAARVVRVVRVRKGNNLYWSFRLKTRKRVYVYTIDEEEKANKLMSNLKHHADVQYQASVVRRRVRNRAPTV